MQKGPPSDPVTKGNILDAVGVGPSLVGPPSTKGEAGQGADTSSVQGEVTQDGESREGPGDEHVSNGDEEEKGQEYH